MNTWQKAKINSFLFEREGRYKPSNPAIANLPRLEKIDFSGNFHIGNKASNTDMILIKQGDFVISGINVAKGAMGIYNGQNDVAATIHYSSYTLDESKINVEYFKRFLKSQEFIRLLNEQVKGGIKTEIKPKHLLPIEINLPDKETQNEIVQHFMKIENEICDLDFEVWRQLDLLKKLRQSILQEAIEGKLTAKWRAENPAVESASVLLEKIKAEKEKLIKEGKIKKEKSLPEIKADEIPFDIPKSWRWCRLADIVDEARGITYGIVKMGNESPQNDIFALRCSDVKWRHIDISKIRKVNREISNQYKRTILSGGEILLNIRGTLGGCAIVDTRLVGFNIAREVGLVPLHLVRLNRFVLNVLTSPYFNSLISDNLRGIAYKGLNLNILNKLLIPIPPLAEQEYSNDKVEQLFTMCDELEEQIKASKSNTEALTGAILKEAFENK